MGSIGGLLGTAGGAAGTGFSTPQQAPIEAPTTSQQAKDAYTANQNALAQQQSLLQALQQQGGLANQSNVYNQLQNIAYGGTNALNPAQMMLNQATAQNAANQAALMAGQRGSSANVGLLARQAAQQGANLQQQAAGQGATMQAQQALGAIQAQGQLANVQAANQIGATTGMTQAQQAEQANLLNAIAAQNNARVGMQSNVNNVSGQLANTQMQGQQSMLGGLMNGAGSVMSMFADGGDVDSDAVGDSTGGYDSKVDAGKTPDVSTPSFGSDAGAAALSGQKSGGGGGGSPLALLALLADGGSVDAAGNPVPDASQPKSSFGRFIKKVTASKEVPGQQAMPQTSSAALQQGTGNFISGLGKALSSKSGSPAPMSPDELQLQDQLLKRDSYSGQEMQAPADNSQANPDMMQAAKGGPVPAMVSPGERYLSPKDVQKVKAGANPMAVGEKIPGKPKVGGAKNSYANDTVPKTLQEGGIVLPRSVTKAKHPHIEAMKFVQQVMRKQKAKK